MHQLSDNDIVHRSQFESSDPGYSCPAILGRNSAAFRIFGLESSNPGKPTVPSRPGPVAVAKDPAAFIRETREVVAALKHRIGREDRELYDLIDRAGLASAA